MCDAEWSKIKQSNCGCVRKKMRLDGGSSDVVMQDLLHKNVSITKIEKREKKEEKFKNAIIWLDSSHTVTGILDINTPEGKFWLLPAFHYFDPNTAKKVRTGLISGWRRRWRNRHHRSMTTLIQDRKLFQMMPMPMPMVMVYGWYPWEDVLLDSVESRTYA